MSNMRYLTREYKRGFIGPLPLYILYRYGYLSELDLKEVLDGDFDSNESLDGFFAYIDDYYCCMQTPRPYFVDEFVETSDSYAHEKRYGRVVEVSEPMVENMSCPHWISVACHDGNTIDIESWMLLPSTMDRYIAAEEGEGTMLKQEIEEGLQKLRKQHPGLRFGQLLHVVFHEKDDTRIDVFYKDDKKLLERIQELIEDGEEKGER